MRIQTSFHKPQCWRRPELDSPDRSASSDDAPRSSILPAERRHRRLRHRSKRPVMLPQQLCPCAIGICYPPFVPGDIPFIYDECREQIAKGLNRQPLRSAVAISTEGHFWHVSGRESAEEARTTVLGNCIGASQIICLVYGVDGQVVSAEPTPLPKTPWFTHDPLVEHPLAIRAIAHLSDGRKK
jgi:hypothetical protein